MSELTLPTSGASSLRELVGNMLDTLRRYWTEGENYQKFAYILSAILIASGVFHTIVFLIDGSPWAGAVSWRKPIVFGFSFGVTNLTIGWIMGFLPRRRIIGWILMGVFSVSGFFEVFLITLQRWRGVPSHFNYSTPFNTAVFNTMGLLVNFIALTIVIVTIWSFFSLKAPTSLKWAIRIGLLLLVISQGLGNMIIANGIPQTIDFATGEFISEGIETASIFGQAGKMKLPHAVTLHAAQVLPLLAWLLLFTNWPDRRRLQAVIIAALGYAGLIAVEVIQTFSGLAPFTFGILGWLVLLVSVVLLMGAYVAALFGLQRSLAQATI